MFILKAAGVGAATTGAEMAQVVASAGLPMILAERAPHWKGA